MMVRILLLASAAVALAGCYVAPAPGPAYGYGRRCPPGLHWVPGHYGPYGGFVAGRCV